MPVSGRMSCMARVYVKPEVRQGTPDRNVADTWHSRYARDTKQLAGLKPLEALKPSLLNLFSSNSLEGALESKMGVPSDVATPFVTGSPNGGSYTFSLDLVAAVCAHSMGICYSY